jgi:hypothetical protein
MNNSKNRAYRPKTIHTYEWFSKAAFYFLIKLKIKSSETGVQWETVIDLIFCYHGAEAEVGCSVFCEIDPHHWETIIADDLMFASSLLNETMVGNNTKQPSNVDVCWIYFD